MLDLAKLSPAPWESLATASKNNDGSRWCSGRGPSVIGEPESDAGVLANVRADSEFIALARNAFDVMMRRRWGASPDGKRWVITGEPNVPDQFDNSYAEPIEAWQAMAEADKWMTAQEAKRVG